MKVSQVTRIVNTWNMFEENEPDISTERLITMVANHCHCDEGTVVDALWIEQQSKRP